MKILSLGLDNSILDKASVLAARAVEYGELVERYTVIVPSQQDENIRLSAKVKSYGSGGGNKLMRFIKIYNLAKKIMRNESYDIITVQDQYYLALIGLKLARKFKIGLEIQVHGFEKLSGIRKLIAGYVLSRTSVVRGVSQRLKKQLISRFGVPEEKITVVPIHSELRIENYPPSASRRRTSELRIKKNGENFIFLTVGRLVAVKNIGLQIEAMAEAVRKFPHVELWIVGDGPERKNYELRITPPRQADGGQANYELKNNVKFFGWKNNLEEYYSQADAFLLTSDSEGWGLAIIEAAQFGLPIIMTDVGCAGEVIKDGASGLVIPVGDKQKLVEAMLKIIKDQDLRKRLGDHAKMAVSRLPSKAEILDLYKASWQKALAEKIK